MKKIYYSLLLTLCVGVSGFSYALQDAKNIMESVKYRDQGVDRYSDVDLIQTMSDGFVRSRSLKMYEKEFGEERKGLLYFTEPSNTAGTGLLMYSYAEVDNKEDDQWLYLPALRKVKRIATNSKEGPFLGTDFSFADIERMRIADYVYTLKEEKENISIIEAKTENGLENPRTGYSQRIVHVDTDKNIIIKDEIFRQGRLIKVFEVVQLEKVNGFWTVVEAKMDNLVEGGSTRLIRKNTQYNQKLKDGLFNQRTLRKGLD
ncbi:outer membrane lipoprotein-sorting protein [Bermanella sp. WJH001]|uniref:outer membrane lipoprotein-sorting protein n=1 Tax=Bermanella sp. WJH001 TaxID=3048005 RepID=UPI0024BDFDE5|nr:outer membrane lipoprotein-sorting protein [Bermanella sp. WJH001]MDJ1537862.1 outer membrane lipoprotein-sorting protein [Bermanella sp. WJH001]